MAEEKPYEPTQSRVERARRDGDVARSQEIGNVAAFAAGLAAVCAAAAPLSVAARSAVIAAAAGGRATAALAAACFWMIVPLAAAGAAAAVAAFGQAGGVRFVAVSFKLERLAPQENAKRMFSREAVVTAVRATIAFACAAAAIVPAFAAVFGAMLHGGSLADISQAAWHGAVRSAGTACGVGALFAGADYALQRDRWRKRLRMSFDEMRRDQKEHDGDPATRGRRRALHRLFARGTLRRIKHAAFVITNPTHLAIALEYRPPEVAVPRVLACAADETAARVRALAAAHAIPIVENIALARQLYAHAKPGEFIPQEAYVAVAEIVAALQRAGELQV